MGVKSRYTPASISLLQSVIRLAWEDMLGNINADFIALVD